MNQSLIDSQIAKNIWTIRTPIIAYVKYTRISISHLQGGFNFKINKTVSQHN